MLNKNHNNGNIIDTFTVSFPSVSSFLYKFLTSPLRIIAHIEWIHHLCYLYYINFTKLFSKNSHRPSDPIIIYKSSLFITCLVISKNNNLIPGICETPTYPAIWSPMLLDIARPGKVAPFKYTLDGPTGIPLGNR